MTTRTTYILTHALLKEVYRDQFDLEWVSSYEPARQTLLAGRHRGLPARLPPRRAAPASICSARRSPGAAPTPIILLTGNDDRDIDVEAMEAGAADYLVKGQFDGPHCSSGRSATRSASRSSGSSTLEALRRSEERYALAVRGANDGLWDWDLTTNRIYYAPRWKSMLGYADGQIGDSPEEWFGRVHPLDVDRVRAEVDAHLSGRTNPAPDRAPHAPR